jgi:16S rRNA (cytosine1402-N4)-methyltransferase
MENFAHIPVLSAELAQALNLAPGEVAVDCTAGGGGHLSATLAAIKPGGVAIGIDRDQMAQTWLNKRFSQELADGNLKLYRGNFSEIKKATSELLAARPIDAIYADLGVSSPQIDTASRGFSFQKEGPLDMRMDQSQSVSAADLLNDETEERLADIFYLFGEEPKSRYFARKIVGRREEKPFRTTSDLATFIEEINPYKGHSRKHPATRIFQALRIAVNGEIESLEQLLSDSFDLVKPGGRLAVITFHSLEDRIVKQFMKKKSGKQVGFEKPLLHSESAAEATLRKPFPANPTENEIEQNPRARSAKLRAIEKLGGIPR